jgi:hypothetical protein
MKSAPFDREAHMAQVRQQAATIATRGDGVGQN